MARNPHKQGGLATPPPELDEDPADEDPAGTDDEDEDQGDAGGEPADDAPARASSSGRSWSAPPSVNDGAGWVLGLLLWGWVGLPFIRGGPSEVKKTLLAKFFNKAPDGSALP